MHYIYLFSARHKEIHLSRKISYVSKQTVDSGLFFKVRERKAAILENVHDFE
jgi:hypothetical protein